MTSTRKTFAVPGDDFPIRHDWRKEEAVTLLSLPFNDLLYKAHCTHRMHHRSNVMQTSTLLSIKTGACPEDCAYCPQSVHYNTAVERETLLPLEQVLEAAQNARANGAERFCMGAAWRAPTDKNLAKVAEMVREVKSLGLETCVTLGMLTDGQADSLKKAGLDYYNHNLDTSPEFYGNIISTRTYRDRLDTLAAVRNAGIKVCAGGILGMGESRQDRAGLLCALANQPSHPESVPINMLVRVSGTPLEEAPPLDTFEFIRVIAAARIMMPCAWIRLSAGRETMSDETQAWCFFAGANSVFSGDNLLTTPNVPEEEDRNLFSRLGITTQVSHRSPG